MLLKVHYTWIWICVFANANPITLEDLEFKDDWNYVTIPNRNPILQSVQEHQFFQKSNRKAKEEFEYLTDLQLDEKVDFGNSIGEVGDSVRKKIPCPMCNLAVGLLQSSVLRKDPFVKIRSKFVRLCVSMDIQSQIVCEGIFDVFGPDLLPVLNFTKSGPKELCRLMLGEACEDVDNHIHEWEIELPKIQKPTHPETPIPKLGSSPALKVLHISDTHFDPDYQEGSIANCNEPLCCRSYSNPKKERVVLPAGKWGAYENCDAPKVLIENMLQNIVKQHPDIDYIIWTGDLPPHDIWNQTKNGSLEILKECVKQMQTAFPNIPILPALGNHEGIPAGNFPPPWNHHQDHSISWLYEEVNRQWKDWLPNTEENSVLHGGFYSVLVRPGFRVISLNMNYCHSLSWWLLVNGTDPAQELKWLVNQLQEAESNGEKVHIIGHIPPGGTDCLKSWSQNYYKIVNRYSDVIVAQFFGHTHGDEFEVFYDTENYTEPVNIAYIGPSVTPYSGQNPAYRVYYVDGNHEESTWEVLDHETWIMDLDYANTEVETDPTWFRLYSAKDSYALPSLRPKEWNKLIYQMVENQDLFHQFYKFYYRNSPVTPKYGRKEKLQMLCDLKSARSQDRLHLCHDLETMMIRM